MKVTLIRSIKGPDKSFIFMQDKNIFAPWHNHPEYELVLVVKGRGKRMVGDNIDRFYEDDLVLTGPYTPHEFLCDPEYLNRSVGFQGECIFVQFLYDFLGDKFFDIPENEALKKFLKESTMGYEIYGEAKKKIISILFKMVELSDTDRLYSLLSIFRIFTVTKEIKKLSRSAFEETFWANENQPMQKALKFISQNFHNPIHIKNLLEITNMSNTAFYAAFKQTYMMPFKDYLLNIRVGYACKLLTLATQNISGIAYNSGFGNISNFNRQFKKIKGITPSEFQEQIKKMEVVYTKPELT